MSKPTISFSVVYCEDNNIDREEGRKMFSDIQKAYPDMLNYEIIDFPELEGKIVSSSFSCDLLILDYRGSDDKKPATPTDTAGMRIIRLNATREAGEIPVVIFSAYFEKAGSRVIQEMKEGYNFSTIPKSQMPFKGFADLKKHILNAMVMDETIPFNFTVETETYALRRTFQLVGKSHLHQIISKLSLAGDAPSLPKISAVVGGLSGAVIVELLQEKTKIGFVRVLIKLANSKKYLADYDALKKEYEAAKKYYTLFPRILVNTIEYQWLETDDETVGGFVMAKVENNQTLYDLLIDDCEAGVITSVLDRLFVGDNSLKQHYDERKDVAENTWTAIFEGFEDRALRVKDAFEEMNPLIPAGRGIEGVFAEMMSLIDYEQWPDTIPKNIDWHTSNFTLCHGDFHAKNVLVQGEQDLAPVLIDTGSLGPAHWTTDLTRLIVYLFSRGIDACTTFYYDTLEMEQIEGIARNIIKGEKIQVDSLGWDDARKENNSGIIHALDWMVENRKEIYESFYCEFEFQLALMKWFLREFYRQQSPPNRRVIALLAACDCFIEAQKSVAGMKPQNEHA